MFTSIVSIKLSCTPPSKVEVIIWLVRVEAVKTFEAGEAGGGGPT